MRSDNEKLGMVTSREQEVLELSAVGHSAKSVAKQLGISPRTVERHLANLRKKLGVRNRSQLAAMAQELGFLANRAKLRLAARRNGDNLNGERRQAN
jgi:DNA-binding CsgD family transcriptional regulator